MTDFDEMMRKVNDEIHEATMDICSDFPDVADADAFDSAARAILPLYPTAIQRAYGEIHGINL